MLTLRLNFHVKSTVEEMFFVLVQPRCLEEVIPTITRFECAFFAETDAPPLHCAVCGVHIPVARGERLPVAGCIDMRRVKTRATGVSVLHAVHDAYFTCGATACRVPVSLAVAQAEQESKQQGDQLKRVVACRACSRMSPPDGPVFKQCKGCHAARYCSRQCQLKDWPKHKPLCEATRATANAAAEAEVAEGGGN